MSDLWYVRSWQNSKRTTARKNGAHWHNKSEMNEQVSEDMFYRENHQNPTVVATIKGSTSCCLSSHIHKMNKHKHFYRSIARHASLVTSFTSFWVCFDKIQLCLFFFLLNRIFVICRDKMLYSVKWNCHDFLVLLASWKKNNKHDIFWECICKYVAQ